MKNLDGRYNKTAGFALLVVVMHTVGHMFKAWLLLMACCLPAAVGHTQSVARDVHGPLKHVQATGDTITYVVEPLPPCEGLPLSRGRVVHTHYARTLDGYLLWHTATGDMVYATLDKQGQLAPSSVLATDNNEELRMKNEEFGCRSPFVRADSSTFNFQFSIFNSQFPPTATQQDSLLVIMVDFQDVPFAHSRTEIENLLVQPGYDSTGSFMDYYRDQSGGRFAPGIRVAGPVTMPQNKAYYNQTNWLDPMARQLLRQALALADSTVDYSHFDNDGDGTADAVIVIYAGGRPAGSSEGLWPHTATLTNAQLLDSTGFGTYCMVEEGDSAMPTIGTLCHEFGHVLGLPDLYDVGYHGCRHPGRLNLMATGNYNAGGRLPPNLSVMERYLLGWTTIDTLTPGDSIEVAVLGSSQAGGWYLSTANGEFFMLEARSALDHWDAALEMEADGLVVYHGKDDWGANNKVNYYANAEGWYPIAADGRGMDSAARVAFTGLCGYDSFTPLSTVQPRQNDSSALDNVWITNIRWTSDSTMAFAYDTVIPEGFTALRPSGIGQDSAVLCYGEAYDDTARYADTAYTKTVTAAGVCDSIVHVTLTVYPEMAETVTDTLQGDSYLWGDTVVTAAGTYVRVLVSEATGCDSTVTLCLLPQPSLLPPTVPVQPPTVAFRDGNIVVTGADGEPVTIFDAMGRMVAHADTPHPPLTFHLSPFTSHLSPLTFHLSPGIYLVKVGSYPALKVVVAR